MQTIFCIEDDESIRELIIYALKSSGFLVKGFYSSQSFFNELKTTTPDLILLDIMLEGDDGISILKILKNDYSTQKIPVIMLTAKAAEFDKVKSLDMGADDYITKPFGVMELISRIKAVLRRSNTASNQDKKLTFKDIEIDTLRHIVTVNGEKIDLTLKEFELLCYLIKNKGLVLSRDKIMQTVWGFDYEGQSRTVDVHITSLRQKLLKSGQEISTIRGIGYKIGG
jgi:two-component system alkaline phosphatase synthesis response regulator PhoP